MWEIWVWSLHWEDLQRREWQPTPLFLPGELHGQRSLVGYSPGVAKSQTRSLSNPKTNTESRFSLYIYSYQSFLYLSKWKPFFRFIWAQNHGVIQGRTMPVLSSKYIHNLITISHHLHLYVHTSADFSWITSTTSKVVSLLNSIFPPRFCFSPSNQSDPYLVTSLLNIPQ